MSSTDGKVCPLCGLVSCPGKRECMYHLKSQGRCMRCGTQLEQEHAHEKCPRCGYIGSCCNP